ncbi:tRNA (adenosine(37)-N6)-dimethylallyltransferase MiaA [Natronospora cellulosivora (SeqCode)]
MKRHPLIVITGPTAVGKTSLSIKIAKKINGEIISADSMQIYKKMDIGTAKISKEEQKEIKHHLLDIVDVDYDFSVAEYQEYVDKLIPEIIKRSSIPILVGGTGLYINAIVEGFLFPQMPNNLKLREVLEKEAKEKGNLFVHEKLKKIDPELANKLHPNDLRRVIRGIEVYEQTGKTTTFYKKKQEETPDRYNALKIGLSRNREELYQRINKRVDIMIKDGLIEEVKDIIDSGYDLGSTALQGLGYKEIINFLNGKYPLEEAVRILKRDTRHFAKRQLTWFRRDKNIKWFNLSKNNQENIYIDIIKLINSWMVNINL